MGIVRSRRSQRLLDSLCPDAYVTDGIRLYRVVASLLDPWSGSHGAQLENCLTLETKLFSLQELRWMRLDLVRPAAASIIPTW
jgi:hypothetical protein